MSIRPIERQFKKRTVTRIRKLQKRVSALSHIAPGMEFFCDELTRSLEGGLLLSALVLVAPLLESSVRELLVSFESKGSGETNSGFRQRLEEDIERFYEDNKRPRWGFYEMIDRLVADRVLRKDQAVKFRSYYKDIRIPLHHGLVRRFAAKTGDSAIAELFGRIGRQHRVEQLLEDRALDLIERGLRLLEILERMASKVT